MPPPHHHLQTVTEKHSRTLNCQEKNYSRTLIVNCTLYVRPYSDKTMLKNTPQPFPEAPPPLTIPHNKKIPPYPFSKGPPHPFFHCLTKKNTFPPHLSHDLKKPPPLAPYFCQAKIKPEELKIILCGLTLQLCYEHDF